MMGNAAAALRQDFPLKSAPERPAGSWCGGLPSECWQHWDCREVLHHQEHFRHSGAGCRVLLPLPGVGSRLGRELAHIGSDPARACKEERPNASLT